MLRFHHFILAVALLFGLASGPSLNAIVAAETSVAPTKQAQEKAAPKKKPAPKKRRGKVVGPAIGGNKATPIDRITAAPGFQVELLYSVYQLPA